MKSPVYIFTLLFSLLLVHVPTKIYAESTYLMISRDECIEGAHKQPQEVFSLYVFRNSALGANIGIVLNDFDAGNDFNR